LRLVLLHLCIVPLHFLIRMLPSVTIGMMELILLSELQLWVSAMINLKLKRLPLPDESQMKIDLILISHDLIHIVAAYLIIQQRIGLSNFPKGGLRVPSLHIQE